MSFDNDVHFERAKDFLDVLVGDEFAPKGYYYAAEPGRSGYIFRGQSNPDARLVAKVHRPIDPGAPHLLSGYTPQVPRDDVSDASRRRFYLGQQLHAEARAVHLFLEQADKLGIPTPIDYSALRHHERLTNALMNEEEVELDEPFPHAQLLAGFALAQHHGIPTRLLDWTESPLIAAYFAAEHSAPALGFAPRYERIAVFCLDTWWIGRRNDLARVSAPRHGNTFLRAQQGVFTYHTMANAYFVEHGFWPCIEELRDADRLVSLHKRHPLVRLTLASSEAEELIRLLWRYDVTRHHVKPAFDSSAQAFAYKKALWPTPTGE